MVVSLRHCEAYEYERLRTVLQQSIADLGGWDAYVKPGQRVLLKPNLLTKKRPDEAATTHPVFVQALASLLVEYGATVIIGDSPGGPFRASYMNMVYRTTGMEAAAATSGASLNRNFGIYEAENPNGYIMKRVTLTAMLQDIDKVICAAKLKTHGMMTYTGATKNMFGMVPGTTKAEYHLNMPDYDSFADALIDICVATAPVLSFIDGIVGMEGNGPGSGTPVHTGAVIASPSAYHADAAGCRLMGIAFEDVPILKRLAARGMVDAGGNDIEYAGELFTRFPNKPYEPPKSLGTVTLTRSNLPKSMQGFVARYVQTRPAFDLHVCNGCGVCRECCPAKIIAIENGKAQLDLRNCIRCYCCQELCPQKAITIYRPLLSKLLRL